MGDTRVSAVTVIDSYFGKINIQADNTLPFFDMSIGVDAVKESSEVNASTDKQMIPFQPGYIHAANLSLDYCVKQKLTFLWGFNEPNLDSAYID